MLLNYACSGDVDAVPQCAATGNGIDLACAIEIVAKHARRFSLAGRVLPRQSARHV